MGILPGANRKEVQDFTRPRPRNDTTVPSAYTSPTHQGRLSSESNSAQQSPWVSQRISRFCTSFRPSVTQVLMHAVCQIILQRTNQPSLTKMCVSEYR